MENPSLTCRPIGYVSTGVEAKFSAGHQPDPDAVVTNRVMLLPEPGYELALQDLAGFERIWLVWWFHRNSTWRPRVMPPRGPAIRRGTFATRSPHRPNPIGLTCVRLLGIEGRVLTVGPLDLMDGTPILDIKPYLPKVDAFPDSRAGWVDEVERELAEAVPYELEVTQMAASQLDWLRENFAIDFTERAFGLLRRDPSPHRTRRILQLGDGRFRMACGAWRLYYHLEGRTVRILSVGKGYSNERLAAEYSADITHGDAQRAFAVRWPEP